MTQPENHHYLNQPLRALSDYTYTVTFHTATLDSKQAEDEAVQIWCSSHNVRCTVRTNWTFARLTVQHQQTPSVSELPLTTATGMYVSLTGSIHQPQVHSWLNNLKLISQRGLSHHLRGIKVNTDTTMHRRVAYIIQLERLVHIQIPGDHVMHRVILATPGYIIQRCTVISWCQSFVCACVQLHLQVQPTGAAGACPVRLVGCRECTVRLLSSPSCTACLTGHEIQFQLQT